MNIVVCEDGKSLFGDNLNTSLCRLLEGKGHRAFVFSGADEDGRAITDPREGAYRVEQLILEHDARGMVLDLQWGKDRLYAINMLRTWYGPPRRIPDDMKIVIYSKYVNSKDIDYIDVLKGEFGIPESCIVDRWKNSIEVVCSLF